MKALELNGFSFGDTAYVPRPEYDNHPSSVLKAASSTRKHRPIVRIKQLNFRKSPSNMTPLSIT